MLGPPTARELDRPVLASLEELVPQDHFYRHLGAKLDLTFVRDLVADRYAVGGRPSIDPVVFIRLQLIYARPKRRGTGALSPIPI